VQAFRKSPHAIRSARRLRHLPAKAGDRPGLGEENANMMATLEQVINDFRRMLPAESATAQAIDRHEPWERIATNAVDDGYIEFANELGSFIEVCLRRCS